MRRAPIIPPAIFFLGIGDAVRRFKTVEPERVFRYLVPSGRQFRRGPHGEKRTTLQGNPGAGILYGRQNINKCLTYRTVRHLDFNTERNVLREARRAWAELDKQSLEAAL